MLILSIDIAEAKQAELREVARLDRCCGRSALRRARAARREQR
jgi:hypothetical protein